MIGAMTQVALPVTAPPVLTRQDQRPQRSGGPCPEAEGETWPCIRWGTLKVGKNVGRIWHVKNVAYTRFINVNHWF